MLLWLFFCCFSHSDAQLNGVIGTQSLGAKYQFNNSIPFLEETTQWVVSMKSNILKFKADNDLNLAVVDLFLADFDYFLIVFRSSNSWINGFSPVDKEVEYNQTLEYAKKLISKFNNTGKTVYLGHEDGDALLLPHGGTNPSTQAVNGMIEWLNVRQKAVDDAKLHFPFSNMHIYHYTEVSSVQDAQRGLTRVINGVVPSVNIDYVSYLYYELQPPTTSSSTISRTFQYISSRIKPRSVDTPTQFFIGEFGVTLKEANFNNLDHQRRNVNVLKALFNAATTVDDHSMPYFVLYRQVYGDKVDAKGALVGDCLITKQKHVTPLYDTLTQSLNKVFTWMQQQPSPPPHSVVLEFISNYLNSLP